MLRRRSFGQIYYIFFIFFMFFIFLVCNNIDAAAAVIRANRGRRWFHKATATVYGHFTRFSKLPICDDVRGKCKVYSLKKCSLGVFFVFVFVFVFVIVPVFVFMSVRSCLIVTAGWSWRSFDQSTSSTQPTLFSSNWVWLIEREQSAKWDCEIVKCRLQTLERWLIRLSELVCSVQKVTMMTMKTTNLEIQHIQITKTAAPWIYYLLLIGIIMISWTFVVVRVGTRQACSSFIASDSEMSAVTPWEWMQKSKN